MATPKKQNPSRGRPRGDRERLRVRGLRPIQIWVPDTGSPAFAAEAHRQSQLVAKSSHAAEDQAFVELRVRAEVRMRRGEVSRIMADKITTVPKAKLGDRIGRH